MSICNLWRGGTKPVLEEEPRRVDLVSFGKIYWVSVDGRQIDDTITCDLREANIYFEQYLAERNKNEPPLLTIIKTEII